MDWWQAFILGIVQGLTEFLPVSSSGHLMIFRELLGVDAEGFLDFTVTVHFATVLSTIVVFWNEILKLLKGFFRTRYPDAPGFCCRYNDETDYVCKLLVSMIPVAIIGFFLKDKVEALFGDSLHTVGICLLVTAALLVLSDVFGQGGLRRASVQDAADGGPRNGISFWQALVVGVGQAFAVAPGLSRSGTTIATGLLAGVRRDVIAQFSFLMVLIPIVGEQMLDILKAVTGTEPLGGIGVMPLVLGFIGAFIAGLFACKVMIAIVKKARLSWFALYCAVVGILILLFA
ncbi:MAG: undecaprenyl-diphosphate phosphatase [Bacteroidales bacterium]|nr:undecaprenyl-diphosphate phosphatase [Bacteroidales bacterium]